MQYPQPITQVLLKIDKALSDELTTDSGLKLYIDPSYRKEHNVASEAVITALPTKAITSKQKRILSQLSVGDVVFIRYNVVASFDFKGDGHRYMPATEENDYVKEFVNGKGEWVKVYALPKRTGLIGNIWIGVHQDKRKEVIDGIQGTEEEVERWMAQFPFGKTDDYSFSNFFEYKGSDYWKCDLEDIFAKSNDGHLVAIGDHVICKPIDIEVPVELMQQVQHHESVKMRYQDRATVLSGGKEYGIKKGNVISFNPEQLEKYSFRGKNYFIINQRLVQGKWN